MRYRTLSSLFLSLSLLVTSFGFVAPKKAPVDEALRKRIATAIVNHLVKKDYAAVRTAFSPALADGLSARQIAEGWENNLTLHGAFEKALSVTPGQTGADPQVRIQCQFHQGTMAIETVFNDSDQIIGLFLKP